MAETTTKKPARTPETLETGVRVEHPSRGSGEVTTSFQDGQEKGFHGEKVDPVPNEHYTVGGKLSKPPAPTGPDLK